MAHSSRIFHRQALRRGVGLIAGLLLTLAAALPAATVLEEQVQSLVAAHEGKRVGLLTNPTGVGEDLVQIGDILFGDPNVNLVSFFAPEHGLRGDQQAGAAVVDYTDPHTGLPVYAVYGSRQAPTASQLDDIDVLVFDIQDVGVRYYTFVWTMTHAMEACAANGVEFIVFDRPNPIGLTRVEGGPNTVNYGLTGRLFSGQPFGMAQRHGLTPGEFATLVNEEWLDPQVELSVITVPGLCRETDSETLGRPWIRPSPNIPTTDTAYAYIATCVFEGTNASEGRGTTQPFENIGAPFIDGVLWAEDLNALGLPGVRFRPTAFIPTFSKHTNQVCSGVFVHVLDREAFDPQRTGLWMLKTLRNRYPSDFSITGTADRFFGVVGLSNAINTMTPEEIIAGWQTRLDAFKAIRANHLLYPVCAQGLQLN
jgi:uncharacterized protein YbbC (DUF1343 family)